MQVTKVAVGTPNYVLMDGNQRIGPTVAALPSGEACTAIYGFSDKTHYDTFARKSELALTPYPLVKKYLHNQIDAAENILKLVVVDAAAFDEPTVYAAAVQVVLAARDSNTRQIPAAYRLDFDREANAYLVTRVDA